MHDAGNSAQVSGSRSRIRLANSMHDKEEIVMAKIDPATYTILGWGKKVVGLKVVLATAQPDDVRALLLAAWQRKTGKA